MEAAAASGGATIGGRAAAARSGFRGVEEGDGGRGDGARGVAAGGKEMQRGALRMGSGWRFFREMGAKMERKVGDEI